MTTVTITKAAKQIAAAVGHDVPASTLRTWANVDLFAPYLSEDANPAPGTTRRFTGHDIEIMTRVAQLRRQNLTYEDIANELATPAPPPATPAPVESPHATTDEHHAALAPRIDLTDVAAIIQTTAAQFEPRLADHDRRLAEVESRSRLVIGIAAGFVVGAVLVAIVAMLIMLR